ncbi:MAG TPA: serine hydrolase domain-containing protein [Stellaceae bacterium]|nr:serine hydrolase domain-containing protein [Stellaceae bacterium]
MNAETRIDGVLRPAVAKGDVPGVVAIAAQGGEIVHQGAFGLRDRASGAAMTPDTIFRIASMTKAVTSVAALQWVERGRIGLDEPVGRFVPELAAPRVLEGFDAAGAPRLRPARRPITLRHLLTHTAGFSYDWSHAGLCRYIEATGTPPMASGKRAALDLPLVCDPGERWEYGINTDWVGLIVEAVGGVPLDVYIRDHITAPLGMTDTGFALSAEQRRRLAVVHRRRADGTLEPCAVDAPPEREFWSGGGGLHATARDYLKFLAMLMQGGRCEGAEILRRDSVALMTENQIGPLAAGTIRSAMPERANDFEPLPGIPCTFGLGFLINTAPGPHGRSAGSLAWAGIYNSYYWLDLKARVAGVILTQLLPFADPHVLALFGAFERAVYDAVGAG